MRRQTPLIAGLALIISSAGVAALDLGFEPYVTAGVGWANHERFAADNGTSVITFAPGQTVTSIGRGSVDDDDIGWKVGAGAWIHEFFGLEFNFLDLGGTSRTQSTSTILDVALTQPINFFAPPPGRFVSEFFEDTSVDLSGFSFMAKTRVPILNWLDMTVGLGAIHWDLDAVRVDSSISGAGTIFFTQRPLAATRLDADDFDFAFNLGAQACLSKHISVGVEWTRYEVGLLDEHVDFLGGVINYQFGDLFGNKGSIDRSATPLAIAVKSLWRNRAEGGYIPKHWEFFIAASGGIVQHDAAGDGDDDGTTIGTETSANVFTTSTTTNVTTISTDRHHASGRISAGVYLSRYFGLEVGYSDFGATHRRAFTSITTVTQPAPGLPVVLVPLFPTTPSLTAFEQKSEYEGLSFGGRFRYPLLKRFE
ncbi:MAG: outer membrane beta-barrel protein, partial [Pseudomonadota bacterium]